MYNAFKLAEANLKNTIGETMSQDVFEIVQEMDITKVETKMILQCAPLIAGLKASNLLSVNSKMVDKVTQIITGTEISYLILWETKAKTTMLLYKDERLYTYLSNPNVQKLLKAYGYANTELEKMLPVFQQHYAEYMAGEKPFPHEIGLFLGYPVEDVEGFIKYEGKNSLYTGYWKVYVDPVSKVKLFEEFDFAKETLIRMHSYGMSVRNIIVSYCNHHKLRNHNYRPAS